MRNENLQVLEQRDIVQSDFLTLSRKNNEIKHQSEIRFFGLSRSGNHAVINWIIRQLEGSYCFLNCAELKHNPFVTARPLNDLGVVYKTNIEDFDLEKERKGEIIKKDYLLYNHEDCFLGAANKKQLLEKHNEWLGPAKKRTDILILRDPFNLFASRMKAGLLKGHFTHHGVRPISVMTLKRLYKQHAREFLGEKNNLRNKIGINFDSWTTDEDYRRKITGELGIPYSAKGLWDVPGVAGGSSFDGTRYSGEAQKMNLNSRWEYYASDPEYLSLFDEELMDLTRKIFGEIPPLRYFENLGV